MEALTFLNGFDRFLLPRGASNSSALGDGTDVTDGHEEKCNQDWGRPKGSSSQRVAPELRKGKVGKCDA
jgi:hypothetical protein